MIQDHVTCGSGCPHTNKNKLEIIDRATCCAAGLENENGRPAF